MDYVTGVGMMKKIAFVVSSLDFGGAQRAVSSVTMALAGHYKIDIILNDDASVLYPYSGTIKSLNVKSPRNRKSLWYQARVFIKRFFYLKKASENNKYDAVISFLDSANIVNVICNTGKHRGNTRAIISVRTSPSEAAKRQVLYKYLIRPFAKALYKRADMVVSVSEELRYELIDEFGLEKGRVIAIPNGFDVNALQAHAKEEIDELVKRRLTGKKVIFTAGRLNFAKHHWHLIRAFAQVIKDIPDSVLVIAGNGELEDYLKKLAQNLGIENDIVFLGFEENVYRYIYRSDIFVFPSGFEGFPNALGEAMCVGAPCVLTDFKTGAREIAAPELLTDNRTISKVTCCEYGIITPVCSGIMYKGNEPLEKQEIELADAIKKLLNDESLNAKYRKKSIERSENLDIRKTVDRWMGVIEGDI